MTFDNLLLEICDGIATLTVNRRGALNALNAATIEELAHAVAAVAADPQVRAVVLTGAGSKSFVAGADIAEMAAMTTAEATELALRAHRVYAAIEASPKPFIAAVNGYALGGGCELAMACDIRIAAETARFGQPEVNLGIIPGFGGTQRLPRLVGKGRALELILTGDMIDAREALRIGLVNRVVAPEELLPAASELAAKIASKGLPALELAKRAVGNGLEMDLGRACDYEAHLFGACFATADQKEGMAAFLEKRLPVFRDR